MFVRELTRRSRWMLSHHARLGLAGSGSGSRCFSTGDVKVIHSACDSVWFPFPPTPPSVILRYHRVILSLSLTQSRVEPVGRHCHRRWSRWLRWRYQGRAARSFRDVRGRPRVPGWYLLERGMHSFESAVAVVAYVRRGQEQLCPPRNQRVGR